jgi:glycosyltransferase involved in cell wall biosynthesis
MKILYIGHYKDGTGWGDAAKNNILALHKAGVNVVPRAISYNNSDSETDETILELEKATTEGCDVCIQHTLPHNYVYDANFKNIGYIDTETSDFLETGWHKSINMMDELWVPAEYVKNACIKSGVTIPIKIVPHCINVSEYSENVKGAKVKELNNTFNFVFVGEFTERKNIRALVRAFHTEFHPRESVNLYIKTSGLEVSKIESYCESIKKGLKLRSNYKNDLIISGRIKKEDYISILNQCHCFIMPSRGEGFCIPALEAMCLGIPSLYTSGIAVEEFAVGEAVNSRDEPCFGGIESLPNLYTANSTWKEIDISDLQIKMRSQYLKGLSDETRQRCKEEANKYSHENIGKLCKELLNDK